MRKQTQKASSADNKAARLIIRNLSFQVCILLLLSARLSHRSSVRLSVRHMGGSVKTVQATITKSSPSAAWKTLVSGTVKLFHKFE